MPVPANPRPETVERKHVAGMSPTDRLDFMKAHPMPAVIGPQGKLYITDHHHLGRAALDSQDNLARATEI
jgi:hypothetical protein